jgi:hypothetical protein
MSLVFQNIDPPTPLSTRRVCTPRLCWGGGGHTRQGERGVGGGSIFWKTRDIGLPSYSNNLSTVSTFLYTSFPLFLIGFLLLMWQGNMGKGKSNDSLKRLGRLSFTYSFSCRSRQIYTFSHFHLKKNYTFSNFLNVQ